MIFKQVRVGHHSECKCGNYSISKYFGEEMKAYGIKLNYEDFYAALIAGGLNCVYRGTRGFGMLSSYGRVQIRSMRVELPSTYSQTSCSPSGRL